MGSSTRNSFSKHKKKMYISLENGEIGASGIGFGNFIKRNYFSSNSGNNVVRSGINRILGSRKFVDSIISLKKIENAVKSGVFDNLGDDFEKQSRIVQAQRLIEILDIEYENILFTSFKEVYEYKKLQMSSNLVKDWIKKICVNIIKYGNSEDSMDVFGIDNVDTINSEIEKVVDDNFESFQSIDFDEELSEDDLVSSIKKATSNMFASMRKEVFE